MSFDSFEQLSEAVWYILIEFSRKKIAESQIVVDFTGGMKVTSVVAAAVTFNRDIKAQYVHTRSCEVIGYDVILSAAEIPDQEIV